MLEEVTQLFGLQIYTKEGVYVGTVGNVLVEVGEGDAKTDSIYVENPNPALVEAGANVSIPFRWIQSIGDVVILKHFPDRVTLSPEERARLYMHQGELEQPQQY